MCHEHLTTRRRRSQDGVQLSPTCCWRSPSLSPTTAKMKPIVVHSLAEYASNVEPELPDTQYHLRRRAIAFSKAWSTLSSVSSVKIMLWSFYVSKASYSVPVSLPVSVPSSGRRLIWYVVWVVSRSYERVALGMYLLKALSFSFSLDICIHNINCWKHRQYCVSALPDVLLTCILCEMSVWRVSSASINGRSSVVYRCSSSSQSSLSRSVERSRCPNSLEYVSN